jgi:hypothetical protein
MSQDTLWGLGLGEEMGNLKPQGQWAVSMSRMMERHLSAANSSPQIPIVLRNSSANRESAVAAQLSLY